MILDQEEAKKKQPPQLPANHQLQRGGQLRTPLAAATQPCQPLPRSNKL
jgi:hypothetical protein